MSQFISILQRQIDLEYPGIPQVDQNTTLFLQFRPFYTGNIIIPIDGNEDTTIQAAWYFLRNRQYELVNQNPNTFEVTEEYVNENLVYVATITNAIYIGVEQEIEVGGLQGFQGVRFLFLAGINLNRRTNPYLQRLTLFADARRLTTLTRILDNTPIFLLPAYRPINGEDIIIITITNLFRNTTRLRNIDFRGTELPIINGNNAFQNGFEQGNNLFQNNTIENDNYLYFSGIRNAQDIVVGTFYNILYFLKILFILQRELRIENGININLTGVYTRGNYPFVVNNEDTYNLMIILSNNRPRVIFTGYIYLNNATYLYAANFENQIINNFQYRPPYEVAPVQIQVPMQPNNIQNFIYRLFGYTQVIGYATEVNNDNDNDNEVIQENIVNTVELPDEAAFAPSTIPTMEPTNPSVFLDPNGTNGRPRMSSSLTGSGPRPIPSAD
jgi:hypothetical protein